MPFAGPSERARKTGDSSLGLLLVALELALCLHIPVAPKGTVRALGSGLGQQSSEGQGSSEATQGLKFAGAGLGQGRHRRRAEPSRGDGPGSISPPRPPAPPPTEIKIFRSQSGAGWDQEEVNEAKLCKHWVRY